MSTQALAMPASARRAIQIAKLSCKPIRAWQGRSWTSPPRSRAPRGSALPPRYGPEQIAEIIRRRKPAALGNRHSGILLHHRRIGVKAKPPDPHRDARATSPATATAVAEGPRAGVLRIAEESWI